MNMKSSKILKKFFIKDFVISVIFSLLITIFFVIIFLIVILIFTIFDSKIINPDNLYFLNGYKCTADILISDNIDYKEIDYKDVIKLNGKIQVLNDNYEVIYTKNSNIKNGYKYNYKEFNDKFINKIDGFFDKEKDFYISIGYNDKMNYILIVEIPLKLFDLVIFINDHIFIIYKSTFYKFNFIFMILFSIILIITTSIHNYKIVISPLDRIMYVINQVRISNYTKRIEKIDKNELGDLSLSINKILDKINDELNLTKNEELERKNLLLNIKYDIQKHFDSLITNSEKLTSIKETNILVSIKSNGIKINKVIKDLILYHKLEKNNHELNNEELNFNEIYKDWLIDIIPKFEEKNIESRYLLDNEYAYIYGNRNFIKLILNYVFRLLNEIETIKKIQYKILKYPEYEKIQLVIIFNYQNANEIEKLKKGLKIGIINKLIKRHNSDINLYFLEKNKIEINLEFDKSK